MAILEVKEIAAGDGAIDERGGATYTRVFLVETDSPKVGPKAVRAAVPIAIGSNYATDTEADLLSFARQVSARRASADGCQWEVTVDYAPYDVQQQQAEASPLDAPLEVSWDFAQWEEICDRDIHGAAIVNKAGDPFDPPVTRDNSRPVLTIARNEADFDPALAYSYKDRINSDAFYGAAAGQVKVANISARRQFAPNFGLYWQVTYEFHFDPRGWAKVILNVGMRQKVGSSREHILDAKGVPITAPVLLDSAGIEALPTDSPVFLTFDVYESTAFSAFNLG